MKPVFLPDRAPENVESVRIVTGEFVDTDTVAGNLRIIAELGFLTVACGAPGSAEIATN